MLTAQNKSNIKKKKTKLKPQTTTEGGFLDQTSQTYWNSEIWENTVISYWLTYYDIIVKILAWLNSTVTHHCLLKFPWEWGLTPPKSIKSHSALSVTFTVLSGVHITPGHTFVLHIWVTHMIRSAPKILAVLQRDRVFVTGKSRIWGSQVFHIKMLKILCVFFWRVQDWNMNKAALRKLLY